MAFPAEKVAAGAYRVLNDKDRVRWKPEEITGWIDEAVHSLLKYVPNAGAETVIKKIVAGKTKHEFPEAYRILDVIRNTDGQGKPNGPAVVYTTKEALDACRASWHTDTGESIYHWVYDPEHDRKVFWVYPAPEDDAYVEMTIVREQDITSLGTEIEMGIQWLQTLLNWVLFRAYAKNADFGGNSQTAMAYLNAFYTEVGRSDLILQRYDPQVEMENRHG